MLSWFESDNLINRLLGAVVNKNPKMTDHIRSAFNRQNINLFRMAATNNYQLVSHGTVKGEIVVSSASFIVVIYSHTQSKSTDVDPAVFTSQTERATLGYLKARYQDRLQIQRIFGSSGTVPTMSEAAPHRSYHDTIQHRQVAFLIVDSTFSAVTVFKRHTEWCYDRRIYYCRRDLW